MDVININAASVALTVGTATARVAIAGAPSSYLLIDNTLTGAVDCYVRSGNSAVVATTSDMHIAAGEKGVYAIDPSHTHVAGITASGSCSVRFVRGNGV